MDTQLQPFFLTSVNGKTLQVLKTYLGKNSYTFLFMVKNIEKVPKYTYLMLQPGLPGTFGCPFVDEGIEL